MSVGLAAIFRRHGPAYIKRYGGRIPRAQLRALLDIMACRTQALGAHWGVCLQCGRPHRFYNSCGNRCCPTCQKDKSADWIASRRAELVPVPYFHLVFTLPGELRPLARAHQRVVLGLLMRTAAEAVIALAEDPRFVGGKVGVLAVLHTWGRTLSWHPHVHCLVTGGGLKAGDGDAPASWVPSRPKFLVHVRPLSRRFRGAFIAGLRKALPEHQVSRSVGRKPWVVYAKPGMVGDEHVLRYLGRYIHRIALSSRRILQADQQGVRFSYRSTSDEGRQKTMRLPVFEFIRRYLQHVPPNGFHRVRYYGLWSPAYRKRLIAIRLMLRLPRPAGDEPEPTPDAADLAVAALTALLRRLNCLPFGTYRCPHCGGLVMIVHRVFPKLARAPPKWRALALNRHPPGGP